MKIKPIYLIVSLYILTITALMATAQTAKIASARADADPQPAVALDKHLRRGDGSDYGKDLLRKIAATTSLRLPIDREHAVRNYRNTDNEAEPRHFLLDYHWSYFDLRRRVNINYQLPIYRLQEGVIGRMLGGWQMSSAIVLPVVETVNIFTEPINADVSSRALKVTDLNIGQALSSSIPGHNLKAVLATSYSGHFTQPSRRQIDLAISKTTRISERIHLQTRVEFFDLPSARGRAANFAEGYPGIRSSSPRIVQLVIRLKF